MGGPTYKHIRWAAPAVGLAVIGLMLVGPAFGGQAQVGPAQQHQRDAKTDQALQEAQAIAIAQTEPRPPKDASKPPRRTTGPVEPAQLPRQGAGAGTIVESGLAPLPGALYTIENRWFERRAGGELIVYAGARRQDPAQGLVVVRPSRADLGPAGVYLTQTRAGSVRVVRAVGERLQLQAATGATFTFDLPGRRFVAP
jgi:hypothetical protein